MPEQIIQQLKQQCPFALGCEEGLAHFALSLQLQVEMAVGDAAVDERGLRLRIARRKCITRCRMPVRNFYHPERNDFFAGFHTYDLIIDARSPCEYAEDHIAPMARPVQLLREDYHHFEEDPLSLLERLVHLRPLVGGEEFEQWKTLAEQARVPELFERLMRNHYDPAYRRSILRNYPDIERSPKISLDDLSPAGLLAVACSMRDGLETMAITRAAAQAASPIAAVMRD